MKKGMMMYFALFMLLAMLPAISASADGVGNMIGYGTGHATRYFIESPRYPGGRFYYVDKKKAVDASLEAECERMGRGGIHVERCVEKLEKITQNKVPASESSLASIPLKKRTLKHSKSQIDEMMYYIKGY